MRNLAELIADRLGVKTETATNRSGSTAGTTAATILRNDPRRVAAVIVNLSASVVYVAPTRDVSASKGIRLSANGGSFSLNWEEDFDLTGYEWFALAEAAASSVFVLEVLIR